MKTNLSYFQHSTTSFLDRDILRLITKYQGNGYLIYVFLKSEIFRDNGYYLKYDDSYHEYVTFRLPFLDKQLVLDVVKFSIEIGLFDREIFLKHKILTSKSIQEDFMEIMKRMNRKIASIISDLDLLDNSKDLNQDSPAPTDDLKKSSEELEKPSEELGKPSEELEKPSEALEILFEALEIPSEALEIPSKEFAKSSEELSMDETDKTQSSDSEYLKKEIFIERKEKERKLNEISLSLNRERLFDIFFMEKNYPIEELEKFLNHYAKTGWIDKNGNKIIDILATARNWKQIDTPIKFYIPTTLHENWKKVWTLYVSQRGFENARYLLTVKPKANSKTITFNCSKEVMAKCEDDIDFLKQALRSVFGNAITLEYDCTNQNLLKRINDIQGHNYQ